MKQLVFANGQGGKHRDTDHAARWRHATAQIAARLINTGACADPTVARLHAEDELAIAVRRSNLGA